MEGTATDESEGVQSHSGRRSVDLDLLRKYDVPVPRYTSYPTALQFDESVDESAVAERLASESEPGRPLSLYFHIPFCRQLCWYCACNRVISKDRAGSNDYVDRLISEVDRKLPLIGGREVVQLHFGGGTPTFLPPEEIRRLGAYLKDVFEFRQDAEVGVEIDPRQCSREQVDALRQAGFNRASVGVQDHNPKVQEAIHRRQPFDLTKKVVGWLERADFRSVNFDLIYGLPHQTIESFRSTLNDVLSLHPDRLAVYSYAHVPWLHPAQKLLEGEALPEAETKLGLLKQTIERLTEAGYRYIGLDHFARPGDDLADALRDGSLRRNFQGYSTFGGTDVHAFGMSGISQTASMYFQNEKELEAYEARLDEGGLPILRGYVLSEDDRIRQAVIEQVMCQRHIDFEALSERFGIDFEAYFAGELDALSGVESDGLVKRRPSGLEITPTGRLFLRNIAVHFDAYFESDENRFSKSV